MNTRRAVASRAGLVAFALLAVSCTESTSPERSRYAPLFSYSANGITLSRSVGTLNQSGSLLVKGFNPVNPHHGDAIIATFMWLGSTFIIDSVYDVITTNPYTPVGNKYTLVEYVQAGGYSMATYVATNVQHFQDAGTDPGEILAVAAQLTQPISDGGLTLSAFTGVDDNFTAALGAHNSKSGSGSQPMFAHADPIAVNAGALVYTATLSGLWGLDPPQNFNRLGPGSDSRLKNDAAYAVQSGAGTSDPQWGWFFGSSDTWLVTTMALNAAPPPASTGNLTVSTSTTGSSLDPDGYTVAVDGGPGQPIAINNSTGVTFTNLAAGDHSVVLSGVASNCTVSGGPSQTVSVPSGGTATAAFSVNCTSTTGNLAVNTTSSGSSIPSSYTVAVDGGTGQTIATTGSFTFTNLTAGNHTVVLTVPSNCSVTNGSASRTATVPSGGTVTVSYTVNCTTPPGNLTVQTSTTGSSVPSSYTVAVDGGAGQSIATTGSFTFTNLAAGNHTVVLTLPSNCSVTNGSASRTATVPSGGTVTVSYTANCTTPPGNLAVTTSSSGASIPASYTVTVDGTQSRTIASNGGSVTFTNLSAGSHTAVLAVPANCTVSGGASRTVSVPSGGTANLSYAVSCNAPPVVNAGPDETALTGLYTLRWSFTDANHNGPWTYTINWGDGSTSSGTVSSEGSFSTGHTYIILLPRSFTVRVTVRDAAGASASDTKVISVLLL